jgi:hypothetical protein
MTVRTPAARDAWSSVWTPATLADTNGAARRWIGPRGSRPRSSAPFSEASLGGNPSKQKLRCQIVIWRRSVHMQLHTHVHGTSPLSREA